MWHWALINTLKKKNSAVLLADGFEIGMQAGSLTYQELSGLFSRMMVTIRGHRTEWVQQNAERGNNEYIPACGEDKLRAALESFRLWRSPRKSEGGRKVGGSGVDPVDVKADDNELLVDEDEVAVVEEDQDEGDNEGSGDGGIDDKFCTSAIIKDEDFSRGSGTHGEAHVTASPICAPVSSM